LADVVIAFWRSMARAGLQGQLPVDAGGSSPERAKARRFTREEKSMNPTKQEKKITALVFEAF